MKKKGFEERTQCVGVSSWNVLGLKIDVGKNVYILDSCLTSFIDFWCYR